MRSKTQLQLWFQFYYPFFFDLKNIEFNLGKKTVKKTRHISPALLAYKWVISVALCHSVMAKSDSLCRHVPTVCSIYPLWFSLS